MTNLKKSKRSSHINNLEDFDKRYLPKYHKKIKFEEIENPVLIGITLAKNSLRKIRTQLAKQ